MSIVFHTRIELLCQYGNCLPVTLVAATNQVLGIGFIYLAVAPSVSIVHKSHPLVLN